MFLIYLFLVLLFISVLCQQGIFEASTFRENSCTGRYQWTSWFDTNDPDQTQVDFEVNNHIQQLFPDILCSSPTAIEAQNSFDTNQKTSTYQTKVCSDYKVRYCCPITTV